MSPLYTQLKSPSLLTKVLDPHITGLPDQHAPWQSDLKLIPGKVQQFVLAKVKALHHSHDLLMWHSGCWGAHREGTWGTGPCGWPASLRWGEDEKIIMYSLSMKRTVHPSRGRGLSQSLWFGSSQRDAFYIFFMSRWFQKHVSSRPQRECLGALWSIGELFQLVGVWALAWSFYKRPWKVHVLRGGEAWATPGAVFQAELDGVLAGSPWDTVLLANIKTMETRVLLTVSWP